MRSFAVFALAGVALAGVASAEVYFKEQFNEGERILAAAGDAQRGAQRESARIHAPIAAPPPWSHGAARLDSAMEMCF